MLFIGIDNTYWSRAILQHAVKNRYYIIYIYVNILFNQKIICFKIKIRGLKSAKSSRASDYDCD